VQGSVEAVADALAKLTTGKVRVAIIHAGVGGITEGDVNLAVASKAIIIGFNVRAAGKAGSLAESEGVEIRPYNIIYNAVDDVRKAMQGMLAPTLIEKALGKAEVRQTFKVGKLGTICGCMVTNGTIKRSGKARLFREGAQVWEGKLAGLKRFKDDVGSVNEGFECGIMLDGYGDAKTGDIIECYEVEEVAATL
jgi:translation initiation factor IF-2